jgi:hypothetical protein
MSRAINEVPGRRQYMQLAGGMQQDGLPIARDHECSANRNHQQQEQRQGNSLQQRKM